MLRPSGEVLYVGKSVRVRWLLSYFRAESQATRPRTSSPARMTSTGSTRPAEFAALLRELRLIKLHHPLFNVEHKRDRSHCFLHLTQEAVRYHVVTRHRRERRLLRPLPWPRLPSPRYGARGE